MRFSRSATMLLLVAFGSLYSGIVVTNADDARPCSGLKVAPCANSLDADEACIRYIYGGPENSCEGEIIEAPFTTVLVRGRPQNNMQESYNFQLCAKRYECTEGGSWSGCVKGDLLGYSYGKENINGGTCEIKNPLPGPVP